MPYAVRHVKQLVIEFNLDETIKLLIFFTHMKTVLKCLKSWHTQFRKRLIVIFKEVGGIQPPPK